MAVVPLRGVRVAVAESLIRDLGKVSELCDHCGMKLNTSKTKTMIVSRSLTMHPKSPPLIIGGTHVRQRAFTHLRAQGIYHNGGVPDSAMEQS